jgi:hypothetical protein
MSFPAPGNAAIGEELRDEGGVRKALLNWFAAQGINPFQNPYAARLVGRSAEVAQLMPGYFQQDSDRQNFINQWAAQQWGGAAPSGGLDFSNKGIIGQIDQTRDINGTPTNLFRTGDSDADAQAIASWRNIANRTYGTQIQQTAARLEAEKGLQFGAWRQQNPTWSGQYADWRLGKTPTPTTFTPPTGTSGATGFTPPSTANSFTPTSGTNPNPSTVQNAAALPYAKTGASSTAYGIGAAGPQGSLTPALTSVNPNLTTFPSAPGNPWEAIAQNGATVPTGPLPPGANANPTTGTGQQSPITVTTPIPPGMPEGTGQPRGTTPPAGTPAATAAITNWKQLLDKYRSDQRSWGTRGFRPNPGAFSIGGITYNPAADQVTGYNNMSGQGRVTNRGNFMGQFLYTLQQLMDQRNRGGNAAIGLTQGMTDDQVARLAWQRLQGRAIGSTGVTG